MTSRQRLIHAEPSGASALYSVAQRDQIRVKLLDYYTAEKVAGGLSSWKQLAGRILAYTEIEIDDDTLRQFAVRQQSRGQPRGISDDNLRAIASCLAHPDINALSQEELDDPDTPYRFIRQLMEFLRDGEQGELAVPPPTLEGTYRAVGRSEDEIFDVRLDITTSADKRFVHLSETADIYVANPAIDDPAALSPQERKRYWRKESSSRGWGILTPEDNLLGFMKRVSSYSTNYYYATLANVPRFTDEAPIEQLALFVSDYPYFAVAVDNQQQWLEDLCRDAVRYNIRHFVRRSASVGD